MNPQSPSSSSSSEAERDDDRFGIVSMILRDIAELDNAPIDADLGDKLIASPEELRVILERHLAHAASRPMTTHRWVSFAEREPPRSYAKDDPNISTRDSVLVTNNIHAQNRMGKMANVWFAAPVWDGERWGCCDDSFRPVYGLTHWLDPFDATPPSLPIDFKQASEQGDSPSDRYLRREITWNEYQAISEEAAEKSLSPSPHPEEGALLLGGDEGGKKGGA